MSCLKKMIFQTITREAIIGIILAILFYWVGGAIISGMLVKGNGSSMIYHIASCPNYDATEIGNDEGDRWFISTAFAESNGFRKAKNCPNE